MRYLLLDSNDSLPTWQDVTSLLQIIPKRRIYTFYNTHDVENIKTPWNEHLMNCKLFHSSSFLFSF